MGEPEAEVRFAAELRQFLKPGHRAGAVRVACDGVSSLGYVVQSLGVPLAEAGCLMVNGVEFTGGGLLPHTQIVERGLPGLPVDDGG